MTHSEGGSLPGSVGDRVQGRDEAVRLEQWQLLHARPGELGATHADRVAGLGHDDGVAAAGKVEDDLREREDRLLGAESRDDVTLGVERRAETAPGPSSHCIAELRQADRGWVAHPLPNPVAQCGDDAGVGWLTWIPHAEVDHLEPGGPAIGCCLIEAHERVGRLAAENGGDRHGARW